MGIEAETEIVVANTFLWFRRRPALGLDPWLVFSSPPYDFYVDRREEMLEFIGGVMEAAPPESLFVVECDDRFDLTQLPHAGGVGRALLSAGGGGNLRETGLIMDIQNVARTPAFITKDGSEIRELLAHRNSCIRNQTLAEARLTAGGSTTCHHHLRTEEIYYILDGQGSMRIGQEVQPVAAGDAIAIPPARAIRLPTPARACCGSSAVAPPATSTRTPCWRGRASVKEYLAGPPKGDSPIFVGRKLGQSPTLSFHHIPRSSLGLCFPLPPSALRLPLPPILPILILFVANGKHSLFPQSARPI